MSFDPLTAVLEIGSKVIDKVWPDPVERDKAKLELFRLQQSGELAQLAAETELAKSQIAVNVEEAKSASLLVSGWRPAIGWICGAAFAWNWIGLPVARLAADLLGHTVNISPADMGEMMPVLLGMLGLSGLRSYDKKVGTAKS